MSTIDDLQAMSDENRKLRASKSDANAKQCKELGVPITLQTKGVYRIETGHGVVMYYASRDKWQYHGRTFTGSPAELHQWLKQRSYL